MKCAEREKWKIEWSFIWEFFSLFRKDFSFVVHFVKSSKSETQDDFYKIYSHIIETPLSKLMTQHGVHGM